MRRVTRQLSLAEAWFVGLPLDGEVRVVSRTRASVPLGIRFALSCVALKS